MTPLTRAAAQAAVADLGWRYILGTLRATVPVTSLAEAAAAATACAAGLPANLFIDLRPDRVLLTITDFTTTGVALAGRLTEVLAELDLATVPAQTQQLELAIDALDIASVRPFWKAALAYADTPDGYGAALIDPLGLSPAVWFQQMDAQRPQRNRIHIDISVPHEEAEPRVAAALAAGGRLVADSHAPAFWVLADAEGNEACITTWQGRD
ncbi:VOC family protein [Dactylosporangium sp. CS-033363]|uniref:VOC family protein n=1 Tax=Dactylosporangium sp. CS-033363 TaxID=3239935 RepID=UPI003D93CB7E